MKCNIPLSYKTPSGYWHTMDFRHKDFQAQCHCVLNISNMTKMQHISSIIFKDFKTITSLHIRIRLLFFHVETGVCLWVFSQKIWHLAVDAYRHIYLNILSDKRL